MIKIDLKKLMKGAALGLFAVLGTTVAASAQQTNDRYRDDQKRQEKLQKEQAKAERQRQAEWARRNHFRTRTMGSGYYTVDTNANVTDGRYRVNRHGTWYNTDNRGADLLRQAVNEGYRQGFAAGRTDRNTRRRGNWTNNNVYRTGTYGYQNGVNQSQYQYYFRQGFQRGYQDGSNSRYQDGYTGDYQYGRNDGGSLNILGTILNQILNIQSY
ncbi:MAG TPA: hypothetical protein VEV84_13360 [Pyrinomonadaceae bacterium]|nr:hypothetical protein [Pyrinomonadaceae bacterium]